MCDVGEEEVIGRVYGLNRRVDRNYKSADKKNELAIYLCIREWDNIH